MAELRIENVPADLHKLLKVMAAQNGTSVREIIIEAAWKAVGRTGKGKAGGK
jgi:plasmid stability protein